MRSSFRSQCKQRVLQTVAACGGFAFCRWRTRRAFRIFAYHGVTDQIAERENLDGFFVSPDVFKAHLRTLAGHYQVMPLTRLVETWMAGEPLPDCAAAITFDDGYANNADIAAPLLQSAGLPATFFVTSGFIDGTHQPWWAVLRTHAAQAGWDRSLLAQQESRLKNQSAADRVSSLRKLFAEAGDMTASAAWRMMSWDQVRSLAAAGFEVGAHTVSHPAIAHEERADIDEEFRISRERILGEIGQIAPIVAYPYGQPEHIGHTVVDSLREQGCLAAVTTMDGLNDVRQDPFFLYRLNVSGNHHRLEFRALASGCTVPRMPIVSSSASGCHAI